MANIICDAVPFCYGPVSKLITLSELLKDQNEITFLVSGTSLDLVKKTEFDIIECDTENLNDLKKVENVVNESDLYINVMNPVSAEFFYKKVPLAYVDSLFWMWDTISPYLFDIEFYFIQNFLDIDKQMVRFGDKIKRKFLVGPIVDDRFLFSQEKRDQLLINFGGMESKLVKVGKNSNYPFFMTEILLKALETVDYDKIIISGSSNPINQLARKYKNSKIIFKSFSHEEFLRELSISKTLLTSPGLTTSFEAFFYQIPTYFLPPQNYSQFLNLKKFRKVGIAKKSLHWVDLYPEMSIEENEEESIGVKKTLKCIGRFENDYDAKHIAVEKIRCMFDYDDRNLIHSQKKFVSSLGGNGAKEISRRISLYLGR